MEISPHFYAWAKWATLTYQYGDPSDFMANMYGVSLYTPRCATNRPIRPFRVSTEERLGGCKPPKEGFAVGFSCCR